MTATVLVGAQWGDEGKGKVCCYLAKDAAVVARYSGGSNAGHTVVLNGHQYKLHLVPAGVFYSHVISILGGGMVIDPPGLLEEIKELEAHGYSCKNLRISPYAHLVFPYHQAIDEWQEAERGAKAIGTTRKGVGPAYADKIERLGIRIGDLLDDDVFREKLQFNLAIKKGRFPALNGKLEFSEINESFKRYREALVPMITDTSKLIMEALRQGDKVLCEGAQGTMLDVDFGTYPYVTSSPTTAAGVACGLGIPPNVVNEVLGVTKAYITRVGEGKFPTQETGAVEEFLRENGHEYGTTTGRPRRCGWLDGLVLKYGHRLNDYSGFIMTKLDILSGLEEVKFCEAYRFGKDTLTEFPFSAKILSAVKPIYKVFPGWQEDISKCTKISQLPKNCRAFLSSIEEYTEVPIRLISVGIDRDQMIRAG